MENETQEKYGCNGYGLRKEHGMWNEKGWAFSILSDVQEMVDMGLDKSEIVEKINNVKRVLMGKYKEIDDGFMIEVEQPKRKVVQEAY